MNAHARKRQAVPPVDGPPRALCPKWGYTNSHVPGRERCAPVAGGRLRPLPAPGGWTSHGTRREVERDGSCDNRRPCRDVRGPGDKAHSPDTGPRGARQTGAAEKQMGSWRITLGRRSIQGDGEFWGRVWWLMEIDPLCYFLNG